MGKSAENTENKNGRKLLRNVVEDHERKDGRGKCILHAMSKRRSEVRNQ